MKLMMKNKRKKIACLGFSANPPHLGHLLVAQQVLNFTDTEEVWLIPCFKHPFGKPLLENKHRWEMTKMMERPGIKACSVELQQKKKSFTIETIHIFKEKYPDHEFSWIIGSDLIQDKSYKRWRRLEELEQEVRFWVFPRGGVVLNRRLPPRFCLVSSLHIVLSNISSSLVRWRLKAGLTVEGLVTKEVESYIHKNLNSKIWSGV